MAWTDPKTWTAALVTVNDLNTHIRDNLNWLKAPTSGQVTLANAITTTSTSWADATGLSVTMTTNGGNVLVLFTAMATHSGGTANNPYFNLEVDGAGIGGTDGVVAKSNTGTVPDNVSFTWVVTGLSAASHTFKIRWKVGTGTGTLLAENSAAGAKFKPMLYVVEAL